MQMGEEGISRYLEEGKQIAGQTSEFNLRGGAERRQGLAT